MVVLDYWDAISTLGWAALVMVIWPVGLFIASRYS